MHVVRTARDSVRGALVAARKLSATLERHSPRRRPSSNSARADSARDESARGDSVHGLPVPSLTDNLVSETLLTTLFKQALSLCESVPRTPLI